MLYVNDYCMQESTTGTLFLMKDKLLRVGSVIKFNSATVLILEVNRVYGKYIANLEEKKAIKGAIKQ